MGCPEKRRKRAKQKKKQRKHKNFVSFYDRNFSAMEWEGCDDEPVTPEPVVINGYTPDSAEYHRYGEFFIFDSAPHGASKSDFFAHARRFRTVDETPEQLEALHERYLVWLSDPFQGLAAPLVEWLQSEGYAPPDKNLENQPLAQSESP